jgi:homopolymeric O-antigen transport system permease protein
VSGEQSRTLLSKPPTGVGELAPTTIRPTRGIAFGVREVLIHRHLLYFLSWRDVKVRYKQTFFGVAWAVIQPLLLMAVFGLFFGRLAGLPSDGLPYPVFALAALVPWTFFSSAFSGAAQSVVRNDALVSKVYFPRLLIPVAAGASFILDFAIATGLLLIVQLFFDVHPNIRIVLLPAIAALALLGALAFGVWFAALNVRYRDVNYVIPFLMQALMFASPIGYPSSIIPAPWKLLYGLNPVAGIIEAFRWSACDAQNHPFGLLAVSSLVILVALAGGLLYFRATERTFADLI